MLLLTVPALAVTLADPDTTSEAVVSIGNCSGVLVSDVHVLTMASCVSGTSPTSVSVLDGPTLMDAESLDVVAVDVHPAWDGLLWEYDIARLTLAEPVTHIDPVPLADEARILDTHGGNVHIIGFGVTAYEGAGSGVRRAGENTLTKVFNAYFEIEDPNRSNGCTGDGGGAILDDDGYLLGILTYGTSCESTGAQRADSIADFLADPASAPSTVDPAEVVLDSVYEPEAEPDPAVDPDLPADEAESGGCATAHASLLGGWMLGLLALAVTRRSR